MPGTPFCGTTLRKQTEARADGDQSLASRYRSCFTHPVGVDANGVVCVDVDDRLGDRLRRGLCARLAHQLARTCRGPEDLGWV
jgi:hypothetical protein